MDAQVRWLEPARWRAAQAAHEARVDAATAGHRDRRARGRPHPVEDFLWVYYRFRPALLRRWHPGPGVVLGGGARSRQATWKHYRIDGDDVRLDTAGFLLRRGRAVRDVAALLRATASRPARFGCFGLHEWAMVYQTDATRHSWPLRLGTAGTDEVVRSRPLRCTHYDAYRFFTPEAVPLNESGLAAGTRGRHEQPGCLHAGMDLYRFAYSLTPGVPSDLVMDCFEHARRAREIDMRASPYDLSDLGYEAIPIETASGRAEYVAQQQALAEAAGVLRARLLTACERLGEAPLSDPRPGRTPARRRPEPAGTTSSCG